MSIRVKVYLDEDSIRELEKDIENKIQNILKKEIRDFQYTSINKDKLEALIDKLIEKGILERSDI